MTIQSLKCKKPACKDREAFDTPQALRMHNMRVHTRAGREGHRKAVIASKLRKEKTNAKENSNIGGSQSHSYLEGFALGNALAQVQFTIAHCAQETGVAESVLAVWVAKSILRNSPGGKVGRPRKQVPAM